MISEIRAWKAFPEILPETQPMPDYIDGYVFNDPLDPDNTYQRILNIQAIMEHPHFYMVTTEYMQYRLWKADRRP